MKIYLSAYCYANLGDDIFIHMIAQRYPQHTFSVVMDSEYSNSYEEEVNVSVVKLNKIMRGMNKLLTKINSNYNIHKLIEKKADMSVVIGGSMFQEFYYDSNALKRLQGLPGRYNPTYIVGSNFGPYETEEYFQTAKENFKNIKDICFRDSWSKRLFPEIQQIRYAPDIIFGIEEIIERQSNQEKSCVISIMDFEQKKHLKDYDDAYQKFILKMVQYYSLLGYKIVLVSFCKNEGDELAIEKIVKKASEELRDSINVVKYDGKNWKNVVEEISKASYLVATRFHSMIFGMVFGIPTLPIIYNDKCLHVLQDLDCENYGIRLEDLESYNLETIKYMVLEDREVIKKQSQEQFKVLDEVLVKKEEYDRK